MERGHFDALTRLIAAQRSRRSAFAALLAATLLGPFSATVSPSRKPARRRKPRGEQNTPSGGKDGKDGKDGKSGTGTGQRAKARKRQPGPATAEAVRCCSGGNCAPGKGKNLSRCCYGGQNLSGKNFQGANLSEASFAGAILANANLQGANASNACFVDADLRGIRTNASTNLASAVLCRTQTNSGEDNSGCANGTPCCPTCDAQHPCPDGQLCCNGRCVTGECCGNGQQSTCNDGQVCCAHACVAGECCAAADCPNQTCQRRACQDRACVYTPVMREPGPRCQTVCCQDAQDEPVCCAPGLTICGASGGCGCDSDADCGAARRCCAGVCRVDSWSHLGNFGDSGSGASQLNRPTGVTVSPDALTAWVADTNNARASVWRRPNATGAWANQGVFGTAGSGANQFFLPFGVAASPDGLTALVVDSNNTNARVSVWDRPSVATAAWSHRGNFGGPGSGASQFRFPAGVALSPDGLTAWVGDQGNNRISVWRRTTPTGTDWVNQTVFGSGGTGPSQLLNPRGVAVSSDLLTVLVADWSNNRISVWTRPHAGSIAWTHQGNIGSGPGNAPAQFNLPAGVAVSPDGQTVWVADGGNNRISVWTRPHAASASWAHQTNIGNGQGSGPSQFSGPTGVATAPDGLTIWVADRENDRVAVWGLGCPA